MNKVKIYKGDKELTINDNYDAIEVMQSHGWTLKNSKPAKSKVEVEKTEEIEDSIAKRRRRARSKNV